MARVSLLSYLVTVLSIFALLGPVNAQLSWDDILSSIISRINGGNGAATTTTTRRTTTTPRLVTTTRPVTTTPRITTTTSRTTTRSTTTSRRPTTTLSTTTSRTTTTTSRTTTRSTTRSTTQSTTTSARATPTLGFTPVVGANGARQCFNRQKIDQMQSGQPETFNLLLLALAQLQTTASNNDLSYYQLSGIHGAPFIPWQMPANGNYDYDTGYCTHHSVIFTTWHRPYVLLLEQTIYQAAEGIVARFNDPAVRATYQNALPQLRLPYWDWSDPNTQSNLPNVCLSSTIRVTRPNAANGASETVDIRNPFFSYRFQGSENSDFAPPLNGWRETARRPNGAGVQNNGQANSVMQSSYTTRRRSTFNSFSRTQFNQFSNDIENVHDTIHGNLGGNGHMSYVPYSAFDPIFWLHHNNIDRLTAMFQAANPGMVLSPGRGVGTFARPNPSQDDINTQLYPFRRLDGAWWTSNDASRPSSMWANGYGYPEVPCSYSGRSASDLDTFTTTQINDLYSSNVAVNKKNKNKKRQSTPVVQSVEWDARVIVDQSELAGTFIIYVYLGTPEADYNLWPLSGKEVGSLSSLGFPDRKKKARIRSATIPLTAWLEDNGIEGDRAYIADFIEKKLTWVVLNNGKPVDVKALKSLKVAVTATEIYTPEAEDKLPFWAKPSYHLECTKNKTGGATKIEDIENPTLLDGQHDKPITG